MRLIPLALLLIPFISLQAAAQTTGAQPATEVEPRPLDDCEVIARVNGLPVLACEVGWQVNLLLEEKGDQIPPGEIPKARRFLMQRHLMEMLDTKLLYGDFRRKAPAEIDMAGIHKQLDKTFDEKEIPNLMKQVGVEDPSELPARLNAIGTSMRAQREDFYQRMISRSWLNESLEIENEVSHRQMLEYYREHRADFEYPTQAKWEELMVRFSTYKNKSDAYRALAAIGNQAYGAAVAQPNRNKPAFQAIAKAKSEASNASKGGQHDWTTKGALTAERIDEALFKLPLGEMSPILESDYGFHIIRVLDRKEAGCTPFTEVQDEIRKNVRDERFKVAMRDKLFELRRQAKIWTLYTGEIDSEEYATARAGGASQRR